MGSEVTERCSVVVRLRLTPTLRRRIDERIEDLARARGLEFDLSSFIRQVLRQYFRELDGGERAS